MTAPRPNPAHRSRPQLLAITVAAIVVQRAPFRGSFSIMSNEGKDQRGSSFWSRIRHVLGGNDSPENSAEESRAPRPKLELIPKEYVGPKPERTEKSEEPMLGIDFGSSYSSIGLLRGDSLELVPLVGDDPMMPSVVSYPQPDKVLVGEEARQQLAGGAQHTISAPKRLLGRLYKDPATQRLLSGLAFETFAGSDRFLRFKAHGTIYSAQDICAEIFAELRRRAATHFGQELRNVVLAAPVGFGSLQRSALEQAARQAGFHVHATLSEPTAAVMAQGFPEDWQGHVGLYDFGGGTFDFTLLEVKKDSYHVLCAGGEPWLGGDDIDVSLAGDLASAFERQTKIDLRSRAVEWQRLLFAVERVKRELSVATSAEIAVEELIHTEAGVQGLEAELTRQQFDALIDPLVQRSMVVVERVLAEAGIKPQSVDAVVMTGGTSLIPLVQRCVGEFFGNEPIVSRPHLAVVQGVCVEGARLSGHGAANKVLRGRKVHDVIGRTIGAAADDGPAITIFARSTPLPARCVQRFTTTAHGKQELKISIFEQHTSRVDETKPLGTMMLRGLKGLPAGQEFVDVTFSMNEHGLLSVNATVGALQISETMHT
ncbi:MAG: Hsp70 family protein [Deltaproteobacteria bacterium]|nr:Hsp70 family protein [Deltaproteobacteria bacterium]